MRLLFAILLVAGLTLIARPASALETGIYFGCAESGGGMVPVATTLVDDGKNLSGAYVFVEADGTRTRGLLANGSRELSGKIEFLWQDKYGKGKLVMQPEADGSGFNGTWSDSKEAGEHVWWGKRGAKMDLAKLKCGERGQT